MVNRTDQLLKFREVDSTVDEIVGIYSEAAKVHEQALIAMGQQPIAEHSTVTSTGVVMNLTPTSAQDKEHR